MQEGNYSAIAINSIHESAREVFEEITFSLDEIMLSVDIEVTIFEYARGRYQLSVCRAVHRLRRAPSDDGPDRDRGGNGQPQRNRLADEVQLRLRTLLLAGNRTGGNVPHEYILFRSYAK